MKKLILLFTVLAFIGCKDEVINYDDITVVDGIAYLKSDMSILNGIVKRWHDNGQLEFEATYKDGKVDGVTKMWHYNGQLKVEGTFKDGKENGIRKQWEENGQLLNEGTFKDGELISEKKWDEDGSEIKN